MSASVIESHDYAQLIGCDFTVTGADNGSFAAYLPRRGTAVAQLALQDWGRDWLVLQLRDPFEYQLGSLDTGFRAVDIIHLIVRSRWLGHPIGLERTSVFVLLDPDHVFSSKQQFRSADFIHVTWAMIQQC
jgi:hypothetical protein